MSIVVGLGITRILSGLSSLLEHRAAVRTDALALVWAVHVLTYHVMFWWVVLGNLLGRESWHMAGFGALLLYGIALYFAASLILPADCRDWPDLRARFEVIRRPFFTIWIIVTVLEVTDTMLKGGLDRVFVEFGPPYVILMSGVLAMATASLWVSDRRFHWVFAVLALFGTLAWNLSRFAQI